MKFTWVDGVMLGQTLGALLGIAIIAYGLSCTSPKLNDCRREHIIEMHQLIYEYDFEPMANCRECHSPIQLEVIP